MPPAQDHKTLLEDNKGPNTGGMGAYAPCNLVTQDQLKFIKDNILQAAITGLKTENMPFIGGY